MERSMIKTIGQYEIVGVLGRGSTSTVYQAFQPALGRYVAVKVLLPRLDPAFAARFEREAQAIGRLQHPNILPIYDYGIEDGQPYVVLQYVENGTTLADLLTGRPIEASAALRLIGHVLAGLDYAHARGVVHRDIKPSNIMMPAPTWPLLADFGIAKLLHDSRQITPPGQTVGTAIYMAPERAAGKPADARSDLYAVGVILYEMVTGRVPFTSHSPMAVLRQHMQDPPPSPRSLNPDLPEPVELVLDRALQKSPDDRYQTADEMAQDLAWAIDELQRSYAYTRHLRPDAAFIGSDRDGSRVTAVAPLPTRASAAAQPAPAPQRRRWSTPLALLWLVLILVSGLVGAGLRLGGVGELVTWLTTPLSSAARGNPTATPTGEASPTEESGLSPAVTASATTAVPTALAEAPVIITPEDAAQPPTATTAPPLPTPQPLPSATLVPASPLPTTPIPPAPTSIPPTPAPAVAGTTAIELDDDTWAGGYNRPRSYGGRTAMWVYGASTEYNTMTAAFDLPAQPVGTVLLVIEGMDSEGPARTPIVIRVNGTPIYSGPNPLPDDDFNPQTGTWGRFVREFDAALLQPGQNTISISNTAGGQFGLPPFFMLDYAELAYELP